MRLPNVTVWGIILTAGCGGPAEAVHYVLPDGFRGCFWVIQDPDAPPIASAGGGWWQVEVPKGGVVRVSDLRRLDGTRDETAVIGGTRTGAGLAVGKTRVAATTVGVWVGPRGRLETGQEYRSYFVGTEAEFVACPAERFVPPP